MCSSDLTLFTGLLVRFVRIGAVYLYNTPYGWKLLLFITMSLLPVTNIGSWHVRILRPYFIGNHSALCDKKRAGKYNKYTYRLLTILYKTSYSKYCMTLYASVCCDSCLCGLCLHYNTTTCIYSYMSRIYHYVSRLYIIEGYGLSHRLKCL